MMPSAWRAHAEQLIAARLHLHPGLEPDLAALDLRRSYAPEPDEVEIVAPPTPADAPFLVSRRLPDGVYQRGQGLVCDESERYRSERYLRELPFPFTVIPS